MFDGLILRVGRATFADDSFKISDLYGPVVDAQLPDSLDLGWYEDLFQNLGRELKWQVVRRSWKDLNVELKRAALCGLREALIVVLDPHFYRCRIEQALITAISEPPQAWPQDFSRLVETNLLPTYVGRSILLDSPAARIQDFLSDDGTMLGGIPGIDENKDEDRTILAELEETLGNSHNIRLFGARSAAAFAHFLDRNERVRIIKLLIPMRYVFPQMIDSYVLAAGERIQRVFDKGNQKTVTSISGLRDAVRIRLADQGLLLIPEDTPKGAIELPSRDNPLLQAADIAAGYARMIYLRHGLKALCEEFAAVILNGSMVRDWTRVERDDSTELRL